MAKIIIFTQNTMASIVATRAILLKNPDQIKAIVLASQFRGESFFDQLRVAYKLTRKSSFNFFLYKLVESKLYNFLLVGHKMVKSKVYLDNRAFSIADLAKKQNIPIIATPDLSADGFLTRIKELDPDYVLCLVAQILKKNVFITLGNRLINAHGSYLPEYRGAAQYFWYRLNNDSHYGVTIHFMDAGLDTGEIIFQRKFAYDQNCSVYQLHHQLARSFGQMLNEFIENYAGQSQPLPIIKQDESKASTTRMPTKDDFNQLKKKKIKLITFKDFFKCI